MKKFIISIMAVLFCLSFNSCTSLKSTALEDLKVRYARVDSLTSVAYSIKLVSFGTSNETLDYSDVNGCMESYLRSWKDSTHVSGFTRYILEYSIKNKFGAEEHKFAFLFKDPSGNVVSNDKFSVWLDEEYLDGFEECCRIASPKYVEIKDAYDDLEQKHSDYEFKMDIARIFEDHKLFSAYLDTALAISNEMRNMRAE